MLVEQIGGRDRCLGRVQFRCGPLRIDVHKGLLVNAANAFNGADVERILAAQIVSMRRLDFTMGDIALLLFL